MARSRDRYDLLIAILMDLEEKEPGHGWLAEALHASERAKARGLVDLLAEARINLREGVDESLLAEERSLETRLEQRRREEEGRLPPARARRHPARAVARSMLSWRSIGTWRDGCAPRDRASPRSRVPSPSA